VNDRHTLSRAGFTPKRSINRPLVSPQLEGLAGHLGELPFILAEPADLIGLARLELTFDACPEGSL
jgi:hypothetical protein